jgi:hypothetical protein
MNIKDIKIGTARDDGRVLALRRKNNKGWWVTPEKFEQIKKAQIQRCKDWREQNKEESRKKNLERYHKNKETYKAKHQEWVKNNRDHINKYNRERRKNDLQHRIRQNLRAGFKQALAAQTKSGFTSNASFKLLGCSFKKLKEHLENNFKDGMSWDNYGKWHIDHIKPLCMHDLSLEAEQKEACHYTNLQPLWAEENTSKGGRWVG